MDALMRNMNDFWTPKTNMMAVTEAATEELPRPQGLGRRGDHETSEATMKTVKTKMERPQRP